MRSYEPLKVVEKTLVVLEELNKHAVRRVVDLKDATGIPAPSLVRILETLVGIGYVQQMSRTGGYCLTDKVHSLSAGHHGLPEVFDGARQVADEFTGEMLWPASVATLDVDAMVVRYSTIRNSPVSHKHSTINRRLDILTRAHGRAYLAFCTDLQRTHIFDLLIHSGRYRGSLPALREEMEPVLEKARYQGIARRDPKTEPETTTLATPVFVGSQLVATFGVTFFKRSVRDQGPLVRKLKEVDERIRALRGTD